MPLFSIIIPTYNRQEILAKTLDCLEIQDTCVDFEVIVVDDSTSVTFPDMGFGKGKRVNWKLLRNGRNLGRAATRNRGICEARGEYVLMIDDDIWASPNLVQAHYEAQKKIGSGVVVGAIPPAGDVTDTVWHRYIKQRFERIHQRLQNSCDDYGLFLTGNVSVPLKLLNYVGGFDETFKNYSFEDTELGLRLYRLGAKFSHSREAIGYHLFKEDLDSICSKAYQAGRSSYVFAQIHPEEIHTIQYHSVVLGKWGWAGIIKNFAKLMLFNEAARFILKGMSRYAASLNFDALVFALIPWVELQHRAKGVREAIIAHRN